MKQQRDEKWLDELIAGNIDTGEPKFDAENWKKKYSREFQTLVEGPSLSRFTVFSVVLKRRAVKIATAAAIIVVIVFFIVARQPSEQPDIDRVSQAAKSPTEMLTVASLNIAYRKGGLEAAEAQFRKAHHKRKPPAAGISAQELLEDFNG